MTLAELIAATNGLHDAVVRSMRVQWGPSPQVDLELDAKFAADQRWRRMQLTFMNCSSIRLAAPPFDGVVLEACLVEQGERLLFSLEPEVTRAGEVYQPSDVRNGSASFECEFCVVEEIGSAN